MDEFLKILHEQINEEEWIEFRAIKKGAAEPTVERMFTRATIQGVRWCAAHSEFDLYVGVCPRARRESTNEAIERTYWLWADIDLKHSDLQTTKELLDRTLQKVALPPTMIVDTGGGLHLYWRITPTGELKSAQEANDALADLYNGDHIGDPARIMRLPGTLNHKYSPPVQTRLIHQNPALSYTLTDLWAVTRLEEKWVNRVHNDKLGRYESRSERDYAVVGALVRAGMSDRAIQTIFAAYKIGDKYREEGSHYLEFSIKKMRSETEITEERGQKIAQIKDWGIVESEGAYFRVLSDGGVAQISTFSFTPQILLRGDAAAGEEDYLYGKVQTEKQTWPGISFPRSAFTNAITLIRSLPLAEWQWLGRDAEVRALLPFLVNEWREHGALVQRATSIIGIHDDLFVTLTQVLNAKGFIPIREAHTVMARRRYEHPDVQYRWLEDADVQQLLTQTLGVLLQVNKPTVMWPTLGWYIACLFKSRLDAQGVRFPILNLVGTRGSGKTTLLTDVLQPFLGYTARRTYDSSTTPFVMLKLLGWSNAIPISFAEYRRSTLRDPGLLLRYVLLSYDEGRDARGHADQTTTTYPLCAPITIDGEDGIVDPACKERIIQILLEPEVIAEGSPAYQAFYALRELSHGHVAGRLVAWSLDKEPQFEAAYSEVMTALPMRIPDRVRRNLAVVWLGIKAFCEFVSSFGVPFMPPTPEDALSHALENVVDLKTGRTSLVVDDFITDVINEVARENISLPFNADYDEDMNVLNVQLSSALPWWIAKCRREGSMALGRMAILQQLSERLITDKPSPGDYVLPPLNSERVYIKGKRYRVCKISLDRAVEAGLDIPTKLSKLFTVEY